MEDARAILATIADRFTLRGRLVDAQRYGNGHINDTFLGTYERDGSFERYIHQRVNARVFPNVPALMENIARVTEHLRRRFMARGDDPARSTLTLVPTVDGAVYTIDENGAYWRTYVFIEGAQTYEVIESPERAFQAARAFGEFSLLLADFPDPSLHETIPHFHDTARRFDALVHAVAADTCNRAASSKREIELALAHEELAGVLARVAENAGVPVRVTHNDTKLNNVMLDDATGRGVCVIDLDTVMPGSAFADFGDMVRTATMPVAEDERDLSKVRVRIDMFEAVARGFAAGTNGVLTDAERAHMVTAGAVITYETAIRFLTDFLEGDRYFKTARPEHNLDRARSQFALLRSIDEHRDALERRASAAFANG